ncbi:MAG TPA: UdgX family uracil-DNA binding protein [Solirubrobacteraceae bacterium]|nr:UdgX family uracil-DNA binding protein [Solirubrobacteraceae bacterium]
MAKQAADATPFLPAERTLAALREAACGCRGCDLWEPATQTVFGEGDEDARMMLVGEVPGDREDREGRPFVGPAGRELGRALELAGIDRDEVYVTNAVKHFRFEERGKRRIHQKPDAGQIRACRPWLRAEVDVVRPEALVVLGATAAKSLLGSGFRVMAERGRPLESELAPVVVATIHPSAILRGRDDESRQELRAMFTDDLRVAAEQLATRAPRRGREPRPTAARDDRSRAPRA